MSPSIIFILMITLIGVLVVATAFLSTSNGTINLNDKIVIGNDGSITTPGVITAANLSPDNNQKIDALTSGVQSLDSQISGIQTSVDNAVAEVETLSNEVSDLNIAVENAVAEVQAMSVDITALNAKTQHISATPSLTTINGDLQVTSDISASNLSGNNTGDQNVFQSIGGVDVNSLTTSLTFIGDGINILPNNVNKTITFDFDNTVLGNLESEVATLQTDVANLETNVSSLQGEIGTLQTDVNNLENNFGSLQTEVGTLQGDVGTLQGDVTTLQTNVNNLENNFGSLQTYVNNLENEVVTLQTDVATIQGNVTTLQTDVGNLQGDVTTLQTDVNSLETNVATLQGDYTTLLGDVSTLQTDVNNLENNVSSLQNEVGTLQGDVTTIQGDIGTIQANYSDLSNRTQNLTANSTSSTFGNKLIVQGDLDVMGSTTSNNSQVNIYDGYVKIIQNPADGVTPALEITQTSTSTGSVMKVTDGDTNTIFQIGQNANVTTDGSIGTKLGLSVGSDLQNPTLQITSNGNLVSNGTVTASNISGTNTGDQNLFSTIGGVTANSTTTNLQFTAGSGITLSTDNVAKSVTFGVDSTVLSTVNSVNSRTIYQSAASNNTVFTGTINGGTLSGNNTGDQNVFAQFAVTGQDTLVPLNTNATLNLVAGSGMTITTDNSTKSVTLASNTGIFTGTTKNYTSQDGIWNTPHQSVNINSLTGTPTYIIPQDISPSQFALFSAYNLQYLYVYTLDPTSLNWQYSSFITTVGSRTLNIQAKCNNNLVVVSCRGIDGSASMDLYTFSGGNLTFVSNIESRADTSNGFLGMSFTSNYLSYCYTVLGVDYVALKYYNGSAFVNVGSSPQTSPQAITQDCLTAISISPSTVAVYPNVTSRRINLYNFTAPTGGFNALTSTIFLTDNTPAGWVYDRASSLVIDNSLSISVIYLFVPNVSNSRGAIAAFGWNGSTWLRATNFTLSNASIGNEYGYGGGQGSFGNRGGYFNAQNQILSIYSSVNNSVIQYSVAKNATPTVSFTYIGTLTTAGTGTNALGIFSASPAGDYLTYFPYNTSVNNPKIDFFNSININAVNYQSTTSNVEFGGRVLMDGDYATLPVNSSSNIATFIANGEDINGMTYIDSISGATLNRFNGAWRTTSGNNTGDQNLFSTIGGVSANSTTTNLQFTAGSGITLSTDNVGKSVTFGVDSTVLAKTQNITATSGATSMTGTLAVGTSSAATSGSVLDLGAATNSLILPKGTTVQQPAAVAGMIRYNTTSNQFEGASGAGPSWQALGGGGSGPTWTQTADTFSIPGNFSLPVSLNNVNTLVNGQYITQVCVSDTFAIYAQQNSLSTSVPLYVFGISSGTQTYQSTYTITGLNLGAYIFGVVGKAVGNRVYIGLSGANSGIIFRFTYNAGTLTNQTTIRTFSTPGPSGNGSFLSNIDYKDVYTTGGTTYSILTWVETNYQYGWSLLAFWHNNTTNSYTQLSGPSFSPSLTSDTNATIVRICGSYNQSLYQIILTDYFESLYTLNISKSGTSTPSLSQSQYITTGSSFIADSNRRSGQNPIIDDEDSVNERYYIHICWPLVNGSSWSTPIGGYFTSLRWLGSSWNTTPITWSITDYFSGLVESSFWGGFGGGTWIYNNGACFGFCRNSQIVICSPTKQGILQVQLTRASSAPFLTVQNLGSVFYPLGSIGNSIYGYFNINVSPNSNYMVGSITAQDSVPRQIFIYERGSGGSVNILWQTTSDNIKETNYLAVSDTTGIFKQPVRTLASVQALAPAIQNGFTFIDSTSGTIKVYYNGTFKTITWT